MNLSYFVYQKALIQTFTPAFWQHNNPCEITAIEHKFKRWFCTQKSDLNVRLKISDYKNKSYSDFEWQIELIDIKG